MEPNIATRIALVAMVFAIAYVFWLTYRDPAKNRLTRFLHSYVEATRFPPLSLNATMLIIIIATLAAGIGASISIIVSAIGE